MLHGKLINRCIRKEDLHAALRAVKVKTDGVADTWRVAGCYPRQVVGYQVASIAIGPDPDEMVLRSQRTQLFDESVQFP